MITIKQLIKVTPFPDDIKQELLVQSDTFSPEKTQEVEESCWALISIEYQNRLQVELRKAFITPSPGQNPSTEEVIEEKLMNELRARLEDTQSEEALTEIRKKLTEEQQSVQK